MLGTTKRAKSANEEGNDPLDEGLSFNYRNRRKYYQIRCKISLFLTKLYIKRLLTIPTFFCP